MVKRVVEQGQCIKEKSMTLIAVTHVQPLSTSSCLSSSRLFISIKFPFAIYAIMIIGTTISFAGKPKIKAIRITPSKPIHFANGSKNPAQCARSVCPDTVIFAMIQITSPAGAATVTALPKTNIVLSKIDRRSTFPICGFRNGGSSSVKEEGTPLRMVAERNRETKKVIRMPRIIIPVRKNAESRDCAAFAVTPPIKNIVIITIIVGKRPLQGQSYL